MSVPHSSVESLPRVTPPGPIPFHVARAYGIERVAPSTGPAARLPSATERLIAAVVPGGIDFESRQPTAARSAPVPFYANPADRNAAATTIELGRRLDVRG